MDIKTIAPWALAAGGAAGVIFAFWNQVKSFWSSLASVAMVNITVQDDLRGPIIVWIRRHGKKIGFGPETYYSSHEHVRSLGRMRKIAFRLFGFDSQTYLVNGRPIWTGMSNAAPGGAQGKFTFIRGTFDWAKITQAALDDEDAFRSKVGGAKSRYRVKHVFGESLNRARAWKMGNAEQQKNAETHAFPNAPSIGTDPYSGLEPVFWSREDFGTPHTSSMESMALDEKLQSVVDEVRFWHRSKSWFQERSLAWRCGLLFHGDAGTGKSSLSRAIAEDLDLPVFVFDLASMVNSEFIEEWRAALSESPCMVLLEDIDGVFHGRTNVTVKDGEGGLTFDCLLNSLDGIERAEGVLLIVTTNHLEHVDPALARLPHEDSDEMPSRPGRIDRMVEFNHLDADGRMKVAMRIVRDENEAKRLTLLGANDTGAQFQLRCVRVARRRFFSDKAAKDESLSAMRRGNEVRLELVSGRKS